MKDVTEYMPKSNWTALPGSLALVFGFWHHECWALLGVFIVAATVAHMLKESRFKQTEKTFFAIALLAYYAAAGDVLVRIALWIRHLTAAN